MDYHDNYMLLDISLDNYRFVIGSIYGPNRDELEFFDNLKLDLRNLNPNPNPVVLGGDWNATWDSNPVQTNIDVINMAAIPSKRRSLQITALARGLSLTDPYRFFNPEKREFTFIPNILNNLNRSRLDFFLISEGIVSDCKSSNIPHSLSSKLLDHKQISLCFKTERKGNIQKIKDTILKDKTLDLILRIHAYDAYINHSVIEGAFTIEEKTRLSLEIGSLMGKLDEIKNVKLDGAMTGNFIQTNLILERLTEEITTGLQALPGLDFFEELPLECSDVVFFETLAMILKNATLSFQSSFYKTKNCQKNRIRNELKNLKEEYVVNSNSIFEKERLLSDINELELKEELSLIKNFERLNDEKITPYFLRLAKSSSQTESLEVVCKDDGDIFDTAQDRHSYIHKYYRDLYDAPPQPVQEDTDAGTGGDRSILDFLGECADNPEVINSKITNVEKIMLDRPLEIIELDRSVKNANINSAPGSDGISNCFITHNWELFRTPLFKYANQCFENGQLSDNFRSAKVRLIPKKGDCSKIKNWRPISLLNCFYKIISRALADRLRKVMDRITSVGQKGYSSSRQCQEVLMNIIDNIQTCKNSGKTGALISLDIRKAFDTISHNFLNKAYRFFNFGENIIKWLNIIGTNRRACIIVENDMYTKFFDLKRGTAQGDTISPYIFNIGYQILLFKLNFDLQIEGTIEPAAVPPDIPPPQLAIPQQEAVSKLTRKAYAFADDANVFSKLDRNTLLRIKTVLEEFGRLSGLECNVEKTTVMCINSAAPNFMAEVGFEIVDSVTILGLEIEGDSGQFNNSFERICTKIANNISSWTRFNLSLPGRICIAKTMLYSQINYLGCFLQIPQHFLLRMSNMITNFVQGNLNIAQKRLFLPTCMGGLGLFELNNFLAAQQCAWISRAQDLNDRWKIILYFYSLGNVNNIRTSMVNKNECPVLYNIVESYEKFLGGYSKHNENFWDSYIFENGAHMVSLRQKKQLTADFFDADFFEREKCKIIKLTVRNFYLNKNTLISFDQFRTDYDLNFNREQFNKIKDMCKMAKTKYSKKEGSKEKCVPVSDFMNRKKKGCKRYRKMLTGEIENYIPHNIVKFAESTETVINLETSKKLNTIWSNTALGNSTRTFLFKFHNNTLGYNQSVAHFVRGHSPNCTFCDILGNQEIVPESPLHLFFECQAVENLTNDIFSWILETNTLITRHEFFTVFNRADHRKNDALNLISKILLKYYWDCKQRHCLPNFENAKTILKSEFTTLTACNKKIRTIIENSGILFNRE